MSSFIRRFPACTVFFLFLIAVFHGNAGVFGRDVTFFVAPSSGDEADGTLESPFRTIFRALNEVKKTLEAGGVEHAAIYLRGGSYYSEKVRYFQDFDFSSLQSPLLISSWKDEKVVLQGGIPLQNWKDEGKGLFSAPIPECVKNPTELQALFFGGNGMTWSRWPNFEPDFPYSGGWAYVAGEPFNMYKEVPGESLNTVVMKEAVKWQHPERGVILLFPRHNWGNNMNSIESLDPEKRTITCARNFRFAARPADRYCVFGMPEELDAPGEWAADVENRRIRFLAPEGTKPEALESGVTLGILPNVLAFARCKNITLHGMEITASKGNGVQIYDSFDVTVEKCAIHDVGFQSGNGVDVGKSVRVTVYGCDIYNTAAACVSMNGGDVYTLESCGSVVENNYLHHSGRYMKGGGAVSVGGCGIRVAHNLGHDFPRGPMSVTGVRNLIEYNYFHHANMESEDTGLIYMNGGGSWINGRGSVVRYNHFSDNIGFGHKNGVYQFYMFSWGIYLDDTSADIQVYGNLVERCTIGCMHLHNARENEIYNNIFVDGGAQQYQLSGWTNDPNGRMMKRHIEDMTRNYEKAMLCSEWRTMRDMQIPPKDSFLPDGTSMRGNHIYRNIFYYPKQPDSAYVKSHDVSFGVNTFSKNIIWNGGKSAPGVPVPNSVSRIVADRTSSIPNVDFARLTDEKLPEGWKYFMSPVPDMQSEVPAPGVFRLYAKYNAEKPYVKNAVMRSASFELPYGKDYRLTCKIRRVGTVTEESPYSSANLYVLADGKGLWMPFSRTSDERRPEDGEFHECSAVFHIPAEGEEKYDGRMTTFCIQFSLNAREGYAEVRDIRLEEVTIADSWESWRILGQDRDSILADPLFMDAAHGDYRLKPESPAFTLGFEPLPLEKMGPYADPRRASWPAREADGVKNHPEWLRIKGEK